MPNEHPLAIMMRELIVQLRRDFRISAAINHNLSAGQAREQVVMALLEKLIPSHFVMVTGLAVNVTGAQS